MYKPSEVIAAEQMLISAIVSGELPADTRTNALAMIGDHSKSLVSRNDLEAFARRRSLYPAFLFDTLAPFESFGGIHTSEDIPRVKTVRVEGPSPTIHEVLMGAARTPPSSSDDKVSRVEPSAGFHKGAADASPPPINRGGRPAEYDWDTFVMEIIRRANHPDGLPDTQAELVRDMLAWFQSTSGREPAESTVKARISKIYRYLAEAKNPDE
ncbi:hypothetical protein [Mesorhizobium marinum]|uniref:hypothetical protein n=1 Tax=Mesorhizobium marinum TaxID=3228790 RepID=UPI0034667765